ncbi:MAG: ArsA family ATPase [Deltaproteobacteria bacterium]|nr:ArsA family ATPase [Deltaproteobacteria bacterium]
MNGLAESLDRSKVLLCLGPGGVGKTTCSAALALKAAARGRRTLVCTVDPARRLATSLGLDSLPDHPVRLPRAELEAAGLAADLPIDAMMLQVESTLNRALAQETKDVGAREAILHNRFYQALVSDLEGTQIYAALAELLELQRNGKWDLIVVDTPPTAHARDILRAPSAMARAVSSPVVRWLSSENFAGRTGLAFLRLGRNAILKRMAAIVGGAFLEDLSEFVGLLSSLLPTLKNRAEEAETLLMAPSTSYVLVTGASADRIDETGVLLDDLKARGLSVSAVVANRLLPDPDNWPDEPSGDSSVDGSDERASEPTRRSSGDPKSASCQQRALDYYHQILSQQHEALDRFAGDRPKIQVVQVPLLPEDLGNLTHLWTLAQHLGIQ